MAPKVSVITCSYNRPDLLRKAVESVRAQTDPDWEHLIYDNGSPNGCARPVLEWAARDPRTRVWYDEVNRDQPAVIWNFLMDRALGRYLTVLDDDNEKLPTFVARMSQVLDDQPEIDVVTCGWRVDRAGESSDVSFLNLSTSRQRLDKESTCDGGAMLYRRTIFERAGHFSEAIRTNEDWDWLRRALHHGRVKNLYEVHCTYRSHGARRMDRAEDLGNTIDVQRVRGRAIDDAFGVLVHYPPADRLTQSQRDACDAMRRGLAAISWVRTGRDLGVVVAPFQHSVEEAVAAVRGLPRAMTLHVEDPYALAVNLERVRVIAGVVPETWVCTNDTAAAPYYRRLVGDRVVICPSLGADEVELAPVERDVDVLLCGYAYPSRKRFVGELLPFLDGLRVLLVGDGWEGFGVENLSTRPLAETYRLHARARAAVCLHRVSGDCSDGPVQPAMVNRGALEGYCGARVFVDRSRRHHSFDDGDVVWFNGPRDLAAALREYLAVDDDKPARTFAEKCRTLYTCRTRLARVLNCVRSPRFLTEVP